MTKFVEKSKDLYIELRGLLKEKKSETERRAVFNIIRENLSASVYKYYIYTIE